MRSSTFPALAHEPPRAPEPPVKIEVRAKPIASFDTRDPQRIRFGALEFRGGLELSSDYQNFGGLSGLYMAPDGVRFLALSDRGRWLRGRIIAEGDKPVRIEDAEMAPILGPDGRPLGARGWWDTELLTMDGGMAYVGIERVNQIVRFDYGRQGLQARGQPIPLPPGVKELPRNQGLEALAFVPRGLPLAGTLIAISERGLDAAGNIRGFLIGGPAPGAFHGRAQRRFRHHRRRDHAGGRPLDPGAEVLDLPRSGHAACARSRLPTSNPAPCSTGRC